MNTKGISFGSILKTTFIGFIVFYLFWTLLIYLLSAEESWQEVSHSSTLSGTDIAPFMQYLNGIDFSDILLGFALVVLPLFTFLLSFFIALTTYIGQFLYCLFKPLALESNEKGLYPGSILKLYIIGGLCTWIPLAIYPLIVDTLFGDTADSFTGMIGSLIGTLLGTAFLVLLTAVTTSFFIIIGNALYGIFFTIKIKYRA